MKREAWIALALCIWPLAGLAVGLAALGNQVSAAYVSSCDAPLIRKQFVCDLYSRLGDADLVMPRDGRYHHPLASVYRTSLSETVRSLVDAERLRPVFLLEQCRPIIVDVEELRASDPQLDSLRNINSPEDYESALRDAGLPANDKLR